MRIHQLLQAYLNREATAQEMAELSHLCGQEVPGGPVQQALAALMADYAAEKKGGPDADHYNQLFAAIMEADKIPAGVKRLPATRKRRWYLAAAAILCLAIATAVLYHTKQMPAPTLAKNKALQQAPGILPGGNKATLTLGDGTVINLDSMAGSTLAPQGGVRIVNLAAGQLAYQAPAGTQPVTVTYNTLATPRGGQYQVILPDGTHVWLNSASSITYPTLFTQGERKVAVTGEAYFEVTANKAMPFKVQVNEQTQVEVLGTAFNINAYSDEVSINTTLLQGAVKVRSAQQQVLLQPGQQAQLAQTLTVHTAVDVEKVMAWKNGLFNFKDASLQQVMRELARWYNIEVSYDKGVKPMEFWGKMGRNLTLAEVLKGLEASGIHYKIDEKMRKLTVLP